MSQNSSTKVKNRVFCAVSNFIFNYIVSNPISYYNLEKFLFQDVQGRFLADKSIGAFDFFSIIVWKSNRSKSKIANRLMDKCKNMTLEEISRNISADIANTKTEKERMRVLIVKWGFKLPIASAILTILYPKVYTIYDYRVAGQLREGVSLKYRTNFENIWIGYVAFRKKVLAIPHGLNLREKDHYLFGKSRMDDLIENLKTGFSDKK
jgi:hypothetical protein